MKKTIKLAVVAALALGSTSVFATNGSNLMGIGVKARGMGGAGIGISNGAESALVNPALITTVKGTELSFGGTVFMPDVSADMGAGTTSSTADMNVIPSVSIATKVNDNLYVGIGMWGTAGMGVDYRDQQANFKMVTNLQLMQFAVPIAYKAGNLSVAVTPILQYGSLDINFDTDGSNEVGGGMTPDLSFGYNVGAAYEVSGLTIGINYKSEIEMEYDTQISEAGAAFGLTFGDELSVPEEISIGASYKMGEHIVAVDYKNIKWSDAKGYKDFKWSDQDVYIIGYAYETKSWTGRLGYNYAKSPIKDQGVVNTSINTLNLLGFPGIVEEHYTLGGTYNLSNKLSVDLAYVYSPEVKQTYTASNFPSPGTRETSVAHSQTGISFGVNYLF